MRLLLVEDSEDLRRLFARALHCQGFDVREAADGQEALEHVQTFRPDVILTDLMMPVLDGYGLMRELQAIPDMARVPVLAYSADGAGEAERLALAAGAVDFMEKPVEIRTLVKRLRALFP